MLRRTVPVFCVVILGAGVVAFAGPPAPSGPSVAPPKAGLWQMLFQDQRWYQGARGPERVFKGTLRAIPHAGGMATTLQRTSYYRLGDRTIYTGAKKMPVLDKLVGKPVEIRGKAVDMNLEGQSLKEIWPGAVRLGQPGAGDDDDDEPDGDDEPAKPDPFAAALDTALDGKRPLADVRINARYEGPDTLAVYGTGVGFVSGTQVTVADDALRTLLKRVKAAGFATMPRTFGGPPPFHGPGPRPMRPVALGRSLTVTIGDASKSVSQLGGGDQSEALKTLIEGLVADLQPLVKTGLKLTDLSLKQACAKLASGALAPEAVSLSVTCTPRPGKAGGERWILRMNRGAFSVMWSGAVPLSREETVGLTKRLGAVLAKEDLGAFPRQLHHPTSLIGFGFSIEGTTMRVNLSADKWPRNVAQAKAHPKAQAAFEDLLKTLKAIHDELKPKAPKPRPRPAVLRPIKILPPARIIE